MTESESRRRFLKTTGLTISYTVAGQIVQLEPAVAYAKGLPLTVLNDVRADTLTQLAEVIVPGATQAGIVHFIDSQLAVIPQESLLMIRYLGVSAPYSTFYTTGLDSLELTARSRFNKSFAELDSKLMSLIVNELAQGKIESWQGPPAEFFYFVLRSDAADVVYGTQAGFANLGIPYMPHIPPTHSW